MLRLSLFHLIVLTPGAENARLATRMETNRNGRWICSCHGGR